MHDDGHRNGSLVQMEEPTAAESVWASYTDSVKCSREAYDHAWDLLAAKFNFFFQTKAASPQRLLPKATI